jgi:phosphonate transport system substrate-binding protein
MFCVFRRLLAAIFLCMPCLSSGFAQAPVFQYTAVPDQDDAVLAQRYEKFAAHFRQKLGVNARYVPVTSYEAAVKAFVSGEVQLAWFGAFSGLIARMAVPGSEFVAQGEKDKNFKTYFIAHRSSGVGTSKDFPQEIRGKSFLFGSPMSTAGRLVPEYWIRQQFGQSSKNVFSRISFSGDHASTLDLVQAGAAEVGALDYTVFEAAQRAGKIDPSRVSVIWETPPFPDYGFVLRGGVNATFGEGFSEKVRQAILDVSDGEILKAFGRPQFVPASNAEYGFIEKLASALVAEEGK